MTGKLIAALALTGLAAACNGGGYGSSSNGSNSNDSHGSSTPTAQVQGTRVDVTESEFHIGLSQTTFSPGVYTFVVRDTGHATHALEIDGPGVEDQKSQSLDSGDTTMLTVTLQSGRYRIYCPVSNHAAQGMDTTITVA